MFFVVDEFLKNGYRSKYNIDSTVVRTVRVDQFEKHWDCIEH